MPRKRTPKAKRKANKRAKLARAKEQLPPTGGNLKIEHRFQFAETWRIKITLYAYAVVATYRKYPQHRRSIVASHIILGILISSIFAKFGSIIRLCCYIPKACVRLVVGFPYLTVICTSDMRFYDADDSQRQIISFISTVPPFLPRKLET